MAFSEKRQARRNFLIVAASVATLALAGCQTGRAPEVEAPPEVAPPPVANVQNGVAVLVPLTGDNAGVGTSIANAAKMALLDADEKSIKITIYDTAGQGGAVAAANAALQDGNRLILGPLLSENVRAIAPAARNARVPVIAFSNDEAVAGDGVYILGFTPKQSIERSVAYAASNGAKSFSGIVPTGEYGQRSAKVFLDAVAGSNGHVVALETYDRSRSAIDVAIGKVNGKGNVDAVLIADGGRIAALAAPKLRVGGQTLGTELWAADDDLGKTAALRGALFAAAPDNRFNQLVNRYRARYGVAPYRLASLGYDATLLAVRAAKSWEPGGRFPVTLLRDPEGFGGVDGIFRFGKDGVAERALEVRRVTATGTSVADPAATRF